MKRSSTKHALNQKHETEMLKLCRRKPEMHHGIFATKHGWNHEQSTLCLMVFDFILMSVSIWTLSQTVSCSSLWGGGLVCKSLSSGGFFAHKTIQMSETLICRKRKRMYGNRPTEMMKTEWQEWDGFGGSEWVLSVPSILTSYGCTTCEVIWMQID